MIEYMKRLAKEFLSPISNNAGEITANLYALSEEIDRLDPRDFVPSVQYEFTHSRIQLRHMLAHIQWRSTKMAGGSAFQKQDSDKAQKLCFQIVSCLDYYGGEGSHAVIRSFSFIGDPKLQQIVERDYRELSQVLLPGAAWKSSVVMAGSILEAILYDALAKDPQVQAKAMKSDAAPKIKEGVKKFENWTLEDLINVAADVKVIPQKRANAIDQSLRDYRNFVHPNKEIRTGYPCTEAEAHLAQGALESVLNHFDF